MEKPRAGATRIKTKLFLATSPDPLVAVQVEQFEPPSLRLGVVGYRVRSGIIQLTMITSSRAYLRLPLAWKQRSGGEQYP
jgi:hypothetical protein